MAAPRALLFLAGTGAASHLFRIWRQSSRSGMRHYLRGFDYMAARYPLLAKLEWLKGIQEDPVKGSARDRTQRSTLRTPHEEEAATPETNGTSPSDVLHAAW